MALSLIPSRIGIFWSQVTWTGCRLAFLSSFAAADWPNKGARGRARESNKAMMRFRTVHVIAQLLSLALRVGTGERYLHKCSAYTDSTAPLSGLSSTQGITTG